MIKNTSVSNRVFNIINYTVLALLGIIFLYPLVYQLAISLSSKNAVLTGQVFLWPVDFSLKAYSTVFESEKLGRAYLNTIYYTALGTIFQMVGTTLLAYPLSKRRLLGRRTFSFFFYFTNIFNGGMIPTFLVVKACGMLDTVWALVIPGCISVYYGIILRTNFENVPIDLEEAAKIDGMTNVGILTKIYMPLSKAIYAALALFFAIGFWNSYMQPLIYLNDQNKQTLQMILRNIVLASQMTDLSPNAAGTEQMMNSSPENLKAASIMVVMLPVMCIYPFVQKYFVKGIMVGAVKG